MTFTAIPIKNRPANFVRAATVGIRGRVVALIAAAGDAGATNDELAAAWGGNGTAAKVGECAAILCGPAYGYPIERDAHPTNRGLDRYRFASGFAGAPSGTAPDATNPPARVDAKPAEPVAEPDVSGGSDAEPDAAEVDHFARNAIDSGDANRYIRQHVPKPLRKAVRAKVAEMSEASPE